MSMSNVARGELYRTLATALFALMLVLATAFANRNVYSKEETDRRVEEVVGVHERDMDDVQRQLDHVSKQVDKLVDYIITEEK